MYYLLKRYCKETGHMVYVYDKMSAYEKGIMTSRNWRVIDEQKNR